MQSILEKVVLALVVPPTARVEDLFALHLGREVDALGHEGSLHRDLALEDGGTDLVDVNVGPVHARGPLDQLDGCVQVSRVCNVTGTVCECERTACKLNDLFCNLIFVADSQMSWILVPLTIQNVTSRNK